MKITYTVDKGALAIIPKGDTIAEHAVSAYGFVLNCSEHRNRTYTGPQFADIIGEVFDLSEPRNAAVCKHLESLK